MWLVIPLPERLFSVKDAFIAGAIIAFFYILFTQELGYLTGAAEIVWWIAAIVWAVILFKKGFNYYRIMNSFGLSFLVIIGFIFLFFDLTLEFEGIPRALALFLTPLMTIAVIGYIHNKIALAKELKRRRKIKIPISKRVRTTLYKLDPIMIVFIVVGFSILIAFLLAPVFMMLLNCFNVPPGEPFYYNFVYIFTNAPYVKHYLLPSDVTWYTIIQSGNTTILLIKGVNYGVIVNSLINSTIVTAAATILGIIVAFVLARYDFPGKTIFRILAMVPLFITPFVNAYAVSILFGREGPISMLTQQLFGFKIWIKDLAGITLAQIMAFYPIVYLNAFSSFISIDPSMEEQAENLGSKGARLFFTVTLPLALPGIIAGSILVFIFSLEDLGAPIVFNYHYIMSYQIYSSFTSETGLVSPQIAALGFIMLFIAVLAFLAVRSFVSMRSYAMISRGGRWKPRVKKLGWKGKLFVYLVLLPLIIFTAMPQISVILLAFNIIPPYGFKIQLDKATAKYFIGIFTNPTYYPYIRNTLMYAAMAVVLATIISIIIAYSVSRTKMRILTPVMDTLATIPLAIPGLVIALGYYFFFSTFFRGTPLDPTSVTTFQAWIVLVIAYTIRKLPFVVRSVYAGFQQVHEALEEASLNLGASRTKTIFRIVLPMITTYIISGIIVGFIYITTEVSTSITIGGLNPAQAPMTFIMREFFYGGTVHGVQYVASMGVLLIIFQLIAVVIITVVLKQRYAFIGV